MFSFLSAFKPPPQNHLLDKKVNPLLAASIVVGLVSVVDYFAGFGEELKSVAIMIVAVFVIACCVVLPTLLGFTAFCVYRNAWGLAGIAWKKAR